VIQLGLERCRPEIALVDGTSDIATSVFPPTVDDLHCEQR
jgi:hypothetical protein